MDLYIVQRIDHKDWNVHQPEVFTTIEACDARLLELYKEVIGFDEVADDLDDDDYEGWRDVYRDLSQSDLISDQIEVWQVQVGESPTAEVVAC